MHQTTILFVFTLILFGCVNQNNSPSSKSNPATTVAADLMPGQGNNSTFPDSVWGQTYFNYDSSFSCSGAANPGYRAAILMNANDHQIYAVDPCTQAQSLLPQANAVRFSYDGVVLYYYDLFQLQPQNGAIIDAWCDRSLIVDPGGGNVAPSDIRIYRPVLSNPMSITWVIPGNYVSMILEGVAVTIGNNANPRTYNTAVSTSLQIQTQSPNAQFNNLYPGSYVMADGTSMDLYCGVSHP